jgi:hypothetical protein
VRDHDDRAALVGAGAQQPQDLRARGRVEVPGRLVGEQHRGVVDERACDREALLLPARELVRQRGGDRPQPEGVDQLAAAHGGRRVRAAHAPGQQHVRFARELGEEVEELEDEADVAPAQRRQRRLGRAGHGAAGDLDGAGFRSVEPAEQVQQGRLAASGAPEHGDDLAGLDVEVGAVEDPPRGAALAERLHEPAGAHHRHTGHGTAVVQVALSGAATWRRRNPARRS